MTATYANFFFFLDLSSSCAIMKSAGRTSRNYPLPALRGRTGHGWKTACTAPRLILALPV